LTADRVGKRVWKAKTAASSTGCVLEMLVGKKKPHQIGGSLALSDGDLDMVVDNGGQEDRLYRNDGNGFYTDATALRLPADNDNTAAVALDDCDGDVDRSGLLDVIAARDVDIGALFS
jgi:hypothetical protein